MTQPIITLRQPVLDQLRELARQQCNLTIASHKTAMKHDYLRINTLGHFGMQAVADYYCVDNPARVMRREEFAEDVDVYGVQVRSTTHARGHLLTHKHDKYAPYVLVTVERVNYDLVRCTLRGWAWLHECNLPRHWRTIGPDGKLLPVPCYMTPQSVLHPIDTLPTPQSLKGQT